MRQLARLNYLDNTITCIYLCLVIDWHSLSSAVGAEGSRAIILSYRSRRNTGLVTSDSRNVLWKNRKYHTKGSLHTYALLCDFQYYWRC